MDTKIINTIEMTRKIRDEHAVYLAGKSHTERITFYRQQAKKIEKKLIALLRLLQKALTAENAGFAELKL